METVDSLNRPVKVGDLVVSVGSGAKYGVVFACVEKIGKVKLTTDEGCFFADKCVIISEQLEYNIRSGNPPSLVRSLRRATDKLIELNTNRNRKIQND